MPMVRWKTDSRPQRHGWAPGEYIHARCVGQLCQELDDSSFIGAKRAIMCADCAYALPEQVDEPAPKLTQEKLIEMIKDMFRQVRQIELTLEEFEARKG
ncbi:hypothetical protein [Bradyrhizobium elkanii]|uniref:Uncharacterized protein n=1 Tax=Bradyrhizobium diazoefficiens TaxID=1355477 RepID=A0A809ZCJ7_9BRAD|nr:hypothetical protein XF1B_48960 [Bradyrhizobium diazoefficiens]BCE48480.1 hypothetical protein XF4B_48290 [Bradyrhizobium diazoefficiens]BCE91996.1 hypothetical protein XF10B_47940 [Bradyrhizobium diazoefficiens]BCF26924.1 hypothetical protein XF14B_48760 [Bradyrhizobium diazoefficiens]